MMKTKTLSTINVVAVILYCDKPKDSRTAFVFNHTTRTLERREHKGNKFLEINDRFAAVVLLSPEACNFEVGDIAYYTPGYRDGYGKPQLFDRQELRHVNTHEYIRAMDFEDKRKIVSIEAANGEHARWHRKVLACTVPTELNFEPVPANVVEALIGLETGAVPGEIFSLEVVTMAKASSIDTMKTLPNNHPSKYRVVMLENGQPPVFADWPAHYGEPNQETVDKYRLATNQSFSSTGVFRELSQKAGRIINYHTVKVFPARSGEDGGAMICESKAAMFEVIG